MILGDLDTSEAAAQLSLLFDPRKIFARRGRSVTSVEDETKLLFEQDYRLLPKVYDSMGELTFRRMLSRTINRPDSVTEDEVIQELEAGISEETSLLGRW